jgi:hypothetical protein
MVGDVCGVGWGFPVDCPISERQAPTRETFELCDIAPCSSAHPARSIGGHVAPQTAPTVSSLCLPAMHTPATSRDRRPAAEGHLGKEDHGPGTRSRAVGAAGTQGQERA